jgi:Pectate lyase superfamily protein
MIRRLLLPAFLCFSLASSLPAQNAAASQETAGQANQPAVTAHGVEGNWRVNGAQTVQNSIAKLPRVDVRHPDFAAPAGCANAADPTGKSDSACAIQAAVAFAISSGITNGGYPSLYIPSGTYRIGSAIRIPCELNVYGDGKIATVIEPVNNAANGITVFNDKSMRIPAEADCNGSLENLTINSPNGHNYTADLLALSGAVGYNLNHVRLSGGGGRGLNISLTSERISSYDLEIDLVRWPMIGPGNEGHFYKTNIGAPGQSGDNYCYGANCVNGVYPSFSWSGVMTLRSASADGKTATFTVFPATNTPLPSLPATGST